ncbi:brorin [Synchiropus splendidus]|uniref:brorin n=1 Tax=Synchiropus splendidus TaxID=270530 RepID=UPI00237DD153|nr:brorin [Synchiropus splendidus]
MAHAGLSPSYLLLTLLLLLPVSTDLSESKLDYALWDYRGKVCLDDRGFVYDIGQVFFLSHSACPCTCTLHGPVCVKPRCPRVHPRCTRIRYKRCCPVCESMARKCVYGGRTYWVLEEFTLSRCERCRCEANREVSCTVSHCPTPHCVDPTYEVHHCCPICKAGPNCFAGSRVIPAGEPVNIDQSTVCYCTHLDGTWRTHPYAICEKLPSPTEAPEAQTVRPGGRENGFVPKLSMIP